MEKMSTPIRDFVKDYAASASLRLHMPGHKGVPFLGCETDDITEIAGADSLFEADGIIRESEENASALFGCPTYYSTEGSSLAIRAMLYLALLAAKDGGRVVSSRAHVLAGRNAHKTFLSAVALLDVDVTWLYPTGGVSYLSCPITAGDVETALTADPTLSAVYLTSPDYLGNTLPIREIADVCHRHGALLLVDNAHGAYLRFLSPSRHPMDLGADLSCDSAHKTLPVLTGGAYLHVSESAPDICQSMVKQALSLFASTSPSYLILQSLDLANAYLADGYAKRLAALTIEMNGLKKLLSEKGFDLVGCEPMKLTVMPKAYGYRGDELADLLAEADMITEFADPDHVVCMLTPESSTEAIKALAGFFSALPRRAPITELPPVMTATEAVLSPREALLSPSETIPVATAEGRILAAATVGCPPAVPILVSGERITTAATYAFDYYGIRTCTVTRNDK